MGLRESTTISWNREEVSRRGAEFAEETESLLVFECITALPSTFQSLRPLRLCVTLCPVEVTVEFPSPN